MLLYELKTLNMDDFWQQEQGWDTRKKSGRKFDDEVELAFWEKIAPSYSKNFNLCRDVPGLKKKLLSLLEADSEILEIGCGTGNFTIPLAAWVRQVTALDFSPAMLAQLQQNIRNGNIGNIRPICGKWEDYKMDYDVDYILSVNSLYRVCYMEQALRKILLHARKGLVLVRTQIRPYLYEIYRKLNISYKHNNDYMLLPLMLWNMGCNIEVANFSYQKPCTYHGWQEVESEMVRNLGTLTYLNFNDKLQQEFYARARMEEAGFVYDSKRVVEVISYIY